jgi:hypothetical protein
MTEEVGRLIIKLWKTPISKSQGDKADWQRPRRIIVV